MSSPSSPTKSAAQPKPQPAPAKTEKEKPKDVKKQPDKKQVERWTSSITALLADPEGLKAFRSFLEGLEKERDEDAGEYTKYIDFFIECEEYKAEFRKLEDKAKDIFETYLSVTAEKEVGAGGKSVEIDDKLNEKGLDGMTLFDEAQKHVKKKLSDMWYNDFCDEFKKLKI